MARASSRRHDQPAAELALGAWMLLLLAVPRIVRLLYPQVWIEDDFYLEDAYLVSVGMRPYLDFVHPHMPLLEWFTAGYIRLFGAGLFSVEVLNEAAIYATSVMTCALAHKAAGRRTAIWAAILYAFAALVFRYHLYERECFVGVAVAAAALVALRDDPASMRQTAIVAALLAIACAIKLTAVVDAAAILCFVAVVQGYRAQAVVAGIGIAAGLIAFSAFLYQLYGFEFLFQTFIFHFMKGRLPWIEVADYPRAILDVMVPLFVIGVARIIGERRVAPALWLILLLVAFNYVFFGLLSPTSWGHNYLDFLPYLAIIAGLGLDSILSGLCEAVRARRGAGRGWQRPALTLVFVGACILWLTPLINENWHASVYGFGFVDRSELRALSDGLSSVSAPDEEVIAPSLICFLAQRRELIRYPETYGVYREAEQQFTKYGFFEARRRLANADFFELIGASAHYWSEPMRQAIDDGEVNAIIADSSIQMMPLVSFGPSVLIKSGFAPYLRTEHFVLWQRVSKGGKAKRS